MNNEGWGLTSFLAFFTVLFLGFFIALVIARKNFGEIFNEDIANKLVASVDNISINNKKGKEKSNSIDYSVYEEYLKEAGILYYKNNTIYEEYVKIDRLIEKEYIKEIHDPNNYNNICKGYVVYNNEKCKSYIRCIGNYATNGYDLKYE